MERLRMELMPVGYEYQQVFINGVDYAHHIKKGSISVGGPSLNKSVEVQVTFIVDDFRCVSASAPGHITETNARGADKDFDGCGYLATEMVVDK
jgi:hypothetical protein